MERRVEHVTLPALLFRDARVVDGIGDEPFEAAVLVVDGHRAEIGALGMRAPDLPGLLADVDVLARPQSTLRMVVTEGRVRLEHLA
jgi:N-acyl-D-aspartate/D-glutamate deacylase